MLAVLNQVLYPGAGDVDDCWVVATVWAARVRQPDLHLPTVPEFRLAADNPDMPGASGGDLDDIMRACGILWPGLGADRYRAREWNLFADLLRAGWSGSLAVLSKELPPDLRFRFYGSHQIGVVFRNGKFLVANPLAKQGTSPLPIPESDLRQAARAVALGWVLAVMFPPEGWPMHPLYVVNETPKMVTLGVGDRFYAPDGTFLGQVSQRQQQPSPYGVTLNDQPFRVLTLVTAGRNIVVMVRSGDVEAVVIPPDTTPYSKADVDVAYNDGLNAADAAIAAVPRR